MESLPQVEGGYGTLLVDFPWPEHGGGKIKRGADRHYSLMSLDQIRSFGLQFRHITSPEGAHLYLWATNNYLMEAGKMLDEWGFRYVTNLCWPKPHFGLGQYLRGQHELCIFAISEHARPSYRTKPDGSRAQWSTLLKTWIGKHSEKPPEIYEVAECVSPPPRIELFARQRRSGWDSWGAEVPTQMQSTLPHVNE